MKSYFMGIDIGTFESKGVLIDESFELVTSFAVKHELENPRANFYEHDAEKVWWNDFCEISKTLIKQSGVDNSRIRCVGASTLGGDCLPVDGACRPLRKAILYGIDSRAEKEIEYLNGYYGEECINAFLGRPFCSQDVAPKILWIKNNEPDVYKNTYKFLTGSSYITAKLTGKYVVDRFLGLSSFLPLYNKDGLVNGDYCRDFCLPEQLAECRNTADVVGQVTAAAASETGLAIGTPVITGTDDSGAEAISVGILQPGDTMIMLGSSLFLICVANKTVQDERIWSDVYIAPQTYSLLGGTNAAGTLTRWFRDNIYFDCLDEEAKTGVNAFELMLKELSSIPAGSDGLITLPYFAGERTPINDPHARGLVFGLKIRHTRHHLYKSALEAVGYSISQHLDIFKENGVELQNFVAVGGGSKNKPWLQMIADIIGYPVKTTKISIGASYGDALMAAIGAGFINSFSDLQDIIKPDMVFQPDLANHETYKQYRSIFDSLYQSTKDLMHKMPG